MEKIKSIENIPLEQIDAFADSFASFNKITQKLHLAYRKLDKEFDNLNLKLEKTNEQLRQSLAEKDRISNYLNNILDSLTSGVLVVNLKGEITLFNKAAEKIIGCSAQEAIGRLYSQIMGSPGETSPVSPGEEICQDLTPLYTLSTGISLMNKEKELRRRQGATIPLGFSTSLVTDSKGNVLGAVEIFRDLTEVRALQEEVKRVHTLAALGQMATTVAHEIRNPLGGIAGFAALLERDLGADDPRNKLAQKITQGVSRLNRVITNLLNYARPIKINLQKVDFVRLVDETIEFFKMDIINHKNGKVTINRSYPAQRINCRIDPGQFRQVILNLLHNATQAMPDGGELGIEVATERGNHSGFISLKITDTGVGIAEDLKTKLFTPFFTTKEDGTGLGLATARKIVEAHQGSISVHSKPGQGSCFVVTLPGS